MSDAMRLQKPLFKEEWIPSTDTEIVSPLDDLCQLAPFLELMRNLHPLMKNETHPTIPKRSGPEQS